MGPNTQEYLPINIGADIGQLRNPTAICVCEVSQVHTGKYRQITPVPAHFERGQWIPPKDADPVMRSEYTIRHIERLPLGTSYPDVAVHIAEMLCSDMFVHRSVKVLMDTTGVGKPVFDMLKVEITLRKRAQQARLIPITFRHGEQFNRKTGMLGKAFMVSKMQALLQGTRIHAPDTKEVKAMLQELKDYEIRIESETAVDRYGAFAVGAFDDLATALGLCCILDPYADMVRYSKPIYATNV